MANTQNGYLPGEHTYLTSGSADILDVVDELRSVGLGYYIDLPQVIVCGDQSSGKSSVLEALSGFSFPRKDNLFPGSHRSDDEKTALRAFTATANISDIKLVIDEASRKMGIDDTSRVFSDDILRIEINGPDKPHLTLVDLPGLFRASTRSQSTSDADVVDKLVNSYMAKQRSIILAVVSAKSDLAMQIVTEYARKQDPMGSRTLGIITKPDLLHVGSESERHFFELAENKEIYFRHGWHVLKNRDFDTRKATKQQRDASEHSFFSDGIWSSLSHEHLGVRTLTTRLNVLLREQIKSELPHLLTEVHAGLEAGKQALMKLGDTRHNETSRRLFLLKLSQRFTTLMTAATEGIYRDTFFGDPQTEDGTAKRLRAVIQNHLIGFAETMRKAGHTYNVVDEAPQDQSDSQEGPRILSREQYIDKILVIMRNSRGKKLPGTYSPELIGELFHAQAQPWTQLTSTSIDKSWTAARRAAELMAEDCSDKTTAHKIVQHVIGPAMSKLKADLDKKKDELLQLHMAAHPTTYNHYFTDNLQKRRAQSKRQSVICVLDQYFGTNINDGETISHLNVRSFDVTTLLNQLAASTQADMDRFACGELADSTDAYYKVAMKTVVDHVGLLCVEQCLGSKLHDIFTPATVMAMSEQTLAELATEPAQTMQDRKTASEKVEILQHSAEILHSIRTGIFPNAGA